MSRASLRRALGAPLAGAVLGLCAPPALAAPAPRAAASLAPRPAGSWVADVIYPTRARTRPGLHAPGREWVGAVTPWGTPTQLLVLGARTGSRGITWLHVLLDRRPNGSAFWIDSQETLLHADPWRILVSRGERTLRIMRRGRLAAHFPVVVGKPSTPTPSGLFAIAAELRQPDAGEFEGAWVLPLTAHSNVLQSFEGGDGQIALHGRGGASLADPLGTARSHGCVRLANSAVAWIAAHVPTGTPVEIR